MHRDRLIDRFTARSPWRLFAALLLATIGLRATGLLTTAMHFAALKAAMGTPDHAQAETIREAFVIVSVIHLRITVLEVVVVGSVAHLMLAALCLRGWVAYALAGLLSGAALCILVGPEFSILRPPASVHRWDWTFILMAGALPCAGGALTFWAVLRPDRERPLTGGGLPS